MRKSLFLGNFGAGRALPVTGAGSSPFQQLLTAEVLSIKCSQSTGFIHKTQVVESCVANDGDVSPDGAGIRRVTGTHQARSQSDQSDCGVGGCTPLPLPACGDVRPALNALQLQFPFLIKGIIYLGSSRGEIKEKSIKAFTQCLTQWLSHFPLKQQQQKLPTLPPLLARLFTFLY